MMSPNMSLTEGARIVVGLGPQTQGGTCDFVSMKGFSRCTALIPIRNGAGAAAGAVTLTQAQDVSNTSGKTLPFTQAYRSLNTGPGGNTDAMTAFSVTGNTFTPDAAAGDNLYAIEIQETDLDVNNGFDCVRVNAATATNATAAVVMILWPAKYGGASRPSAIQD